MNSVVLSNMTKIILTRSLLILVYFVLIIVMFLTGRTHTLLIDNKGAEDGSYKAERTVAITVGKTEPVELMKNDRDKFSVKGQGVQLYIEFFDGKPPLKRNIRIPLGTDTVLLSLPKLIADIEPYIEAFDLYALQQPITTADRKGDMPENIFTSP